jgi:3-deoxy-D-manno-octulosonic-acid transferase
MYFLYSLIYTLGVVILLPRFVYDAITKGKYAAGFRQRLGSLPPFDTKGRKVVWLHCVSVGEANAARPLAQKIKRDHPETSIVVSTTTRTGQEIARKAFSDSADLVFYFPFDWRFTVRRALRRLKPSLVLLMETEIWFNFIREAYHTGAHVCIVNGRLSEKSFNRYTKIGKFMKRVLGYLDLALMQTKTDATRLMSLGARASKVKVTGNLKFDQEPIEHESNVAAALRDRFGVSSKIPLIIAASTHSPEEKWILDAFKELRRNAGGASPRLLIAPRHPERFDEISELIRKGGFTLACRSKPASGSDRTAEVILLDIIGELRAAYQLAEIVFVGGSLIPHGGQSVLEPAAAGKAIVTGPHTANFMAVVEEFLKNDALIQLCAASERDVVAEVVKTISELLSDDARRRLLGANALGVMETNAGASLKTAEYLSPLLSNR